MTLLCFGAVTVLSACRPGGGGPATVQPTHAATNGTTGSADGDSTGFGLPPHGLPAHVDSIIDGDTIVVSIGNNHETLRLLGIDTPEKAGGPRPAECHGEESTVYLTHLIPPGTPVLLTRDVEPRDVYGRLLTYVFRAEDDLFVNLSMLEAGAADVLNIAPNSTFSLEFQRAARHAKDQDHGLWAACGSVDVLIQ